MKSGWMKLKRLFRYLFQRRKKMSRDKILQQICARLATLESDREEARLNGRDVTAIDSEMKALRLKLQDVINSPCPLIKD